MDSIDCVGDAVKTAKVTRLPHIDAPNIRVSGHTLINLCYSCSALPEQCAECIPPGHQILTLRR